ncbi:unnamed protein product [Parascedosporium putredinis]|uniref:MOSC domain-containing protein n=1 Tax=Parascedosporium putredinis TaxID=1442378 RepID=A0A9P1GVF1_9PEZI|nr:unnamed protein product [Parascedosporium putredinis]CAI7987785.1 unnamed protein product [Parascedosporium putredinis]
MIDFTLDEAIAVFDTQTTIVFLITLCSFFIPVFGSGLQYDRLYTFARLKDASAAATGAGSSDGAKEGEGGEDSGPVWDFVTQRQFPRLAKVGVDIWCPDAARLPRHLRVWREVMTALNMEEELPRDLAEYLGINERLGIFRTSPMMSREVHRNAPNADEAGYQPTVRFQDSYPVHLMNIASVEDMATKIEDPTLKDLSVRRFRANVVITGPPAYDEDHWKTFRLKQGTASVHSDCTYHVSCRTSRCKLPNVDPATAIPHPVEPDRYLRKHRNIDDGCPKNGCLGMMLTPSSPTKAGAWLWSRGSSETGKDRS